MSTTRISDLPENITMTPGQYSLPQQMPQQQFQYSQQMPQQQPQQLPPTLQTNKMRDDDTMSTNYVPMNIHANPYGISAQNPIMQGPPIPSFQQPVAQQYQQMQQLEKLSAQQQQDLQYMQPVRLPSRDIPMDSTQYLNDEQVQPNYIPKASPSLRDYVGEHENITEKNIQKYEQKKYRENQIDEWLSEFQTPIFIVILFFIFQMPAVNTLIFKRFSFLSIYNLDGNFNFNGLLLKSLLFGSLYYFVQKFVVFVSEF